MSLARTADAIQQYGNLDSVGAETLSLAIFAPIEIALILGFVNMRLRSLSVQFLIFILVRTIVLITGLIILLQGISLYSRLGHQFIAGENVAPMALLISGSVLTIIGLWILFARKQY